MGSTENLAYFDGLPLAPWPQGDIGTALWCLFVAVTERADTREQAEALKVQKQQLLWHAKRNGYGSTP